jgi:hypothetical protein
MKILGIVGSNRKKGDKTRGTFRLSYRWRGFCSVTKNCPLLHKKFKYILLVLFCYGRILNFYYFFIKKEGFLKIISYYTIKSAKYLILINILWTINLI